MYVGLWHIFVACAALHVNVIDATVMLISSIFTSMSQAPKCPPLVLAAGLGQLARVQQLIRDGEGTLEDCDEVCMHTL